MRLLRFFITLFLVAGPVVRVAAERLSLVWPTPNRAFLEGKPLADFIQPTVSGETHSGLYGSVRSNGTQFHEGIDLLAVGRDKRGEPTDAIYAVTDGVVRHINRRSGDSNYGCYVVLEHPDLEPAIYTLYAHLSAIAPGLDEGEAVKRAQILGTMGHTSSSPFPKERAHVHFEMGFRITDNFQRWYDHRKFGSPNKQGLWNGMNLTGFDPLDFYTRFKTRAIDNVLDYLATLEPAVRLRIATRVVPDFVKRYPALLTTPVPANGVGGWEVRFSATGLPYAWTPLSTMEVVGLKTNEVRVLETDDALLKENRGRKLVLQRGGKSQPGRDLETLLQQLFGLK